MINNKIIYQVDAFTDVLQFIQLDNSDSQDRERNFGFKTKIRIIKFVWFRAFNDYSYKLNKPSRLCYSMFCSHDGSK